MEKYTVSDDLAKVLTDAAQEAIKAGEGMRPVNAGGNTISVGDTFVIKGANFVRAFMMPRDRDGMDAKKWNSLSDVEKTQQGVERRYFMLQTDKQDISVSGFILEPWARDVKNLDTLPDDKKELAKDFDINKVYLAKHHKPNEFVRNELLGLIGKTVKCVGKYSRTPDGQTFEVSGRYWQIVD